MTNAGQAKTFTAYLSGFSQELNWRETEFEKRLHRVRVCSLCGVVPSEASLLGCRHVFCPACYDGVAGSGHLCPIDGASFDETSVTSLKFPECDLLERKIRCWNKRNGCDFSGSLADALCHFHEECTFHEVRCVKCRRMVRQRDMLDHYERDCKGESEEEEPRTPTLVKDIVKSTNKVEEVFATLTDMQLSLQDSLNSLAKETRCSLQNVEKCIQDQSGQLFRVLPNQECSRATSEALEEIRCKLTWTPGWVRHQDWLKKKCDAVLQMSDDQVLWSVENLAYHLECVRKAKEEQAVSEPFTIGGYRARLCVKFVQADNDINVEVFFHLCRGPKDEELDWPFNRPFVLSLVHPKDRGKDSKKPFNPLECGFPEVFHKPTTVYNGGIGGSCFAKASVLDEFVLNDAILVSVQLLPH